MIFCNFFHKNFFLEKCFSLNILKKKYLSCIFSHKIQSKILTILTIKLGILKFNQVNKLASLKVTLYVTRNMFKILKLLNIFLGGRQSWISGWPDNLHEQPRPQQDPKRGQPQPQGQKNRGRHAIKLFSFVNDNPEKQARLFPTCQFLKQNVITQTG